SPGNSGANGRGSRSPPNAPSSSARSWTASRPRPSADPAQQVFQELLDPSLDVVSDRPHLLDWLAGGVVDLPVDVALAGQDRACIPTPHRHHHVGGGESLVRPCPRPMGRYVD